jgi:hypothetical protein
MAGKFVVGQLVIGGRFVMTGMEFVFGRLLGAGDV